MNITIKCVNNEAVEQYLSVGKTYDAVIPTHTEHYMYVLTSDTGEAMGFEKERFEVVS